MLRMARLARAPCTKPETYSLRPFIETRSIFVHIPKCAGISVLQALYRCRGGGHLTLHDYAMFFGPRLESMFVFTFLRHPVDRLASAFRFLAAGGLTHEDAAWAQAQLVGVDTFQQFVLEHVDRRLMNSVVHLRPQWEFLDVAGQLGPLDFIGCVEDLKEGVRYVATVLGRPVVLTHENRSLGTSSAARTYSRDVVRRIEELYATDMELYAGSCRSHAP
jgi:Sulfotransferase family.